MGRLVARALAFSVPCLAGLGCIVWPQGAGPGAAAMPLAEALALRDRGEGVLIDVRSRAAYAAGHVPGALNITSTEIESQAAAIRRMGRRPILYCG